MERWQKGLIFFAAISLFLYFVYNLTESPYWIGVVAAIIFFDHRRFLVPSKITLDDDKISISMPMNEMVKNWSSFKRSYPDKNGILLSPFAVKSFLEKFKGVYVIFGENTPPNARQFILSKVPALK